MVKGAHIRAVVCVGKYSSVQREFGSQHVANSMESGHLRLPEIEETDEDYRPIRK